MADPRVSIVVVSHNYGAFLDEALSSVAAQTRPPGDVVLVDDASTDDTAQVIEAWCGRLPLNCIRNEQRLGPARTFNIGMSAARGDLLMKLDGDDRLSPTYVARLERALEESGAEIAYTGLQRFGAETYRSPARAFDRKELMKENFINGSAMMRRQVWERTGGYRSELDDVGLEDWELFVHAIALGMRAVPVDDCWLEYRRHASGSRNTISRRTALRAHLLVRRMHRDAVGLHDVGEWMLRSTCRTFVGASTRRR